MNSTEQLYRELNPTPTLKEVLLRMRKVHINEIDHLQKRVDAIDKRVDELETEEMEHEANVCRECGHTPETGACYFCKAD